MIRRLVAALTAVLVLAGCQDDPEPNIAEPSPSPTAASSTPVVSESAEPETAEAFIRRWSKTSVAMQNNGDTSAYRLMTAGCPTCTKFADLIDSYYQAGGSVTIGGQTVTGVRELEATPPLSVYDVSVDPEPTTYKERAGGAEKTLQGNAAVLRVTLRRKGASWEFIDYTQLAS